MSKSSDLSSVDLNGFGNGSSVVLTPTPPKEPMTRKSVIKNLLIICVGFLLMFCAFQALSNLQSTLNSSEDMGVASQSVLYASLIVSSFFLPTFIIGKLGIKRALAFCLACYCPYILANMFPRWWTMIPAAILLGLGAAPMWSAKCTYLNEIGFRYSRMIMVTGSTPEEKEVVLNATIARFIGIFFAFFQSSQIWGNLISFLVLDQQSSDENKANSTTDDVLCGIHFDFSPVASNNTNIITAKLPDYEKVDLLIGIYLGMGVAAVALLLIFLDPLERENSSAGEGQTLTATKLVMATFKHLINNKEQVILVPLTIFSGLEQSFFMSEYTKAYVACSWGIAEIGFVVIAFGVVNAIVSPSSGHLIKWFGRKAIFIVAALTNVGVCVALLTWTPDSESSKVTLFVLAGLWGLGDAVWQTQINALYGILFKGNDEPAYANYRMWESLGFVFAFAVSKYLDIVAKIAILLSVLLVGILGYMFIEIKIIPKKVANND